MLASSASFEEKKCDEKEPCSYFSVEKVYIGKRVCEGVWQIRNQIGASSAIGKVSKVCCKDNCNFVLKLIEISDRFPLERFQNEVRCQQLAAENNLAPEIYEVWEGQNSGFVMDMLKISAADQIREYLKGNKQSKVEYLLSTLERSLKKLHKIGILHGDPHLDNFMYNEKAKKWQFIDFGESKITNKGFEQDLDNFQIAVDLFMDEV